MKNFVAHFSTTYYLLDICISIHHHQNWPISPILPQNRSNQYLIIKNFCILPLLTIFGSLTILSPRFWQKHNMSSIFSAEKSRITSKSDIIIIAYILHRTSRYHKKWRVWEDVKESKNQNNLGDPKCLSGYFSKKAESWIRLKNAVQRWSLDDQS